MDNLYELTEGITRAVTPENLTGGKGMAAMSLPEPGTAAERLGRGWKCRPFTTIQPHEEQDLCSIDTCGVITSMWMAGEMDRGLIFRMYWDGSDVPAVECPLMDFFCYGWAEPTDMNENHWNKGPLFRLNSALMSIAPNRGFSCFIPMPFRSHARITLENRTKNIKRIYYQINYEERKLPENIGYFHAQFRASLPVRKGKTHVLLDQIEGQGTYLGTALFVGLNRAARWWGEGEFKFYLDGDKEFPTITSTGLEDYFLGAFNWDCENEYQEYSHLYSGMPQVLRPDGLYQIQQRFSLYRWHVKDPIRFTSDLRVEVQALGWMRDDDGKSPWYLQREDDYQSVAYFYLDHPAAKLPELPSHEELTEPF